MYRESKPRGGKSSPSASRPVFTHFTIFAMSLIRTERIWLDTENPCYIPHAHSRVPFNLSTIAGRFGPISQLRGIRAYPLFEAFMQRKLCYVQ